MATFKHILIATDFSETSEQALKVAVDLAQEGDGVLTVVHTCEIPPSVYSSQAFAVVDLMQPIVEIAEKKLDQFMIGVRGRYPRASGILKVGVPWEQILDAAVEVGADLIVAGTHGRRGVAHAVLGSVAEKIVRLSTVPVLTVRSQRAGTSR